MEKHHQTINHFAIITGNTLTYLKVDFVEVGFLPQIETFVATVSRL